MPTNQYMLVGVANGEDASGPWAELWNKTLQKHKIGMEARVLGGIYTTPDSKYFIYRGKGVMQNLQTKEIHAK